MLQDLSSLSVVINRIIGNEEDEAGLIYDIRNDVEDERELQCPENWETICPITQQDVSSLVVDESLAEIIEKNSREVAKGTDLDYRRLMASLDRWCKSHKYIGSKDSIFDMEPTEKTPLLIIGWIMEACDNMNPDGTNKPPGQYRGTYTNAMKMRSSATYGFGRIHRRGNTPWSSFDGVNYMGNPSVSIQVSRYMLAIKRRKHADGELAMSSRAITAKHIKEMYEYRNQPERLSHVSIEQVSRSTPKSLDNWGGPRLRLLTHVITVISFTCLLRSDEVVNLRAEDVTVLAPECISICLTSRKTAQFGTSKPFILWRLPEEEIHLCPVRALAHWIKETEIVSGYLFRHVNSKDCVSTDDSRQLQSSTFLEAFRNSLIDIGQDPHAYGTHSLRRGGCQWLAKECRWPIPQICEWGGWAKDFSHLTIVRYLIGWNDNMNEAREDFFNPNRPPNLKCHTCGRTCWHS